MCAGSLAAATATPPSTAWAPCAATTTSFKPLRATTRCSCSRWGGLDRIAVSVGPGVLGVDPSEGSGLEDIEPGEGLVDRFDLGCSQVAAMLLKEYKEQFSGAPVRATWSYLRQWALGNLPPNPLVTHETDARHLRDPAFLKRTFRCGCWDSALIRIFGFVSYMLAGIVWRRPAPTTTIDHLLVADGAGTGLHGCCRRWRRGCASTRDAWAPSTPGTSASTTCWCASALGLDRACSIGQELGDLRDWSGPTLSRGLIAAPAMVQELANAHVESVVLDCFYDGVNNCVDPDCRKALKVRTVAAQVVARPKRVHSVCNLTRVAPSTAPY